MKKQRVIKILVVLILSIAGSSYASATILQGNNKEYIGKEIRFYRYSDPITLQKELAFTINFDSDGSFKENVSVEIPGYFFSEFGIYRGMLVLNSAEETELRFPPLREKSFADKKNPYFEPVSFWFATKSNNKITDKIASFENEYNKLTDQFFNYLYFRQSEEVFDSLQTIFDQKYPSGDSEILATHKTMKLEALKADAFRLKPKEVAPVISDVNPRFWTFPSFISFFQKTFSNALSFEARKTGGDKINKAVAQCDADFLLGFVTEKYNLSGKTAKLVLLKLLHDAYYSGEFSQDAIVEMLASGKLSVGDNQIGNISARVLEKLRFLKKGTKAPVICLKDIDGRNVCSTDFSEKYKYLLFADTEMMVCREHLKYLTEIQRKFGEQLQIVTVLRKTDLIEMKMFLDKQQIPGIKLVDDKGEFIEKYKVQSFPVAFLLNKNHEVVFEHTKNPLDGFEQQFATFLRNKRIEDLRNQQR